MYFYTYKITNLINGKIYIGAHKTRNLEDGYMGSGVVLKRAKEKYGIENFHKEILMFHDSEDEMFEIESLIVDAEFLKRKDVYNAKLGGQGGWDHINSSLSIEERIRISRLGGQSIKNKHKSVETLNKISEASKRNWQREEYRIAVKMNVAGKFKGLKHTDETKRKMSVSAKARKPEQNSQFGKMWVHSLDEKRSTRINKSDPIPKGWIKGRKIKF